MTHAQAQFHFSPNWKYSFHLLCVPPSQELRLSLGWNGRNGAKLSEMKYALSRLSPKWKKKKKARGRTFGKFNKHKIALSILKEIFQGLTLKGTKYRKTELP